MPSIAWRLRRRRLVALAGAAVLWPTLATAADAPSWSDPTLLEAARKEGTLTIYTSVNEQEGLPIWRHFEQETGLKVEYIRGSDSQMIGRILIENRGGRPA